MPTPSRYARRVTRAALATFLAVASASLLALGIRGLSSDARAADRYAAMVDDFGPSDGEGPSWDALAASGVDADGWLTVSGTTVDTPVMQATAGDPEHWLHRAADGSESPTGTPFVDHRCAVASDVTVVYGHRTAYLGYLFHDLASCHEQPAFDRLGTARLYARDGSFTDYRPLCSASTDSSDGTWRSCIGLSGDGLRSWLSSMVPQASARAAGAQAEAAAATRLLVLATCNGRAFHPETRTVVLFVSCD
ncbi:MAG: class B sortase [Coriobacteriaceae bacterium]|nr:class B sortase [Coriobacteriaceae bacterium]MDD7585284.1 class B sortase [Coriobacteriaceae bacterium]